MYISSGRSLKSEKEAYDKASMRLDRYYSCQSYVDALGNVKVYVIPKKNATVKGPWSWKRRMKDFVENTEECLEEYYRREQSEAGFSVDKRWFGWQVAQRREDRIERAISCANLWHNLFNLYPT